MRLDEIEKLFSDGMQLKGVLTFNFVFQGR
jgi:hypothetical protein